MSIITRDFDTMADAILDRIVAADVGITFTDRGSVIRAITEALAAELDIMYYQIEQLYIAYCIDDAEGEDLDKGVAILGVKRIQAQPATSTIRFGRSTPATSDIFIDSNYIVSTTVDQDGNVVEVKTTESKYLLTGETYVDLNVEMVEPGYIFLPAGSLTVMPNPIIGIESVTNINAVDGGSDVENDISLRDRAKLALSEIGKGTDSAIESAIKKVPGVVDVIMLDQNRGVGTSDALVVCTQIPPDDETGLAIDNAIKVTKSSGINVGKVYPTIKSVAIDLALDGTIDIDTAGNTIRTYLNTVKPGATVILSQLEARIVDAYGDDPDLDARIISPTVNPTSINTEVIRPGDITINGVIWNG